MAARPLEIAHKLVRREGGLVVVVEAFGEVFPGAGKNPNEHHTNQVEEADFG